MKPAITLIVIAAGATAQPSARRPKFEVASVKRCADGGVEIAMAAPGSGGRIGGGGGGVFTGDPGWYRVQCRPLLLLIETAYLRVPNGEAQPVSSGIGNPPVQGGPGWLSERYSIDARPETPQTRSMMAGPMMQDLLEDRFKLKVHRETKDVAAFALAAAKGGVKLRTTKGCTAATPGGPPPPFVNGQPPPCGSESFTDEGMDLWGCTVAELCRHLRGKLHQDVLDKTGIAGAFDIHLAGFGPPPPPGAAQDPGLDAMGVVTNALQMLGMRLEATKSAATVLVVDHVERPADN